MIKDNIFFRMSELMNNTDIDAFTAQKNIGSRVAYFEMLDNFIEAAPGIAQTLEHLSAEGGLPVFLEFVDNLQNKLMDIGASSLVWELEKTAVFARENERKKCIDESHILAARLRTLQEKIREAKIEKPTGADRKTARQITVTESERESKPRAAARSEQFEKLIILVENFEHDDALVMLRSLLDFSYGTEIDASLVAVYNALATFDYDGALQNLRHLLQTAQTAESDKQKNGMKKILAIDDVPDVLATVKAVLNNRYQVYGVTNHKAALKFLTSNHADLILLDIEMPYMNGFTMLGIIRRIKKYEHTPVLFLTGSVSVENVKKSHDLGANDFIRKPIEASVLISKIEKQRF